MIVTKETTQELETLILDLLKHYPVLDVVVRPHYRTRTNEQNALWQIWIKEVCEQSGLYNNSTFRTKKEAEDYLKNIIKHKACLNGYPVKRKPNGNLELDKNGDTIPYETKDVSISDFKLLLDTVQIFAQEHDIILTERY